MTSRMRGMTLIDVAIGSAVTLVVFLALFGLLRLSIALSNLAGQTSVASALASDRLEAIRALPYADIEPGETLTTTTENGIPYDVRTEIATIDDPADGVGSADADGETTDYKRATVTVSYTPSVGQRTLSLSTILASSTPLAPMP